MKSYPFTPDMKKLPVEQLFDCMAAKLVEFAHECGQDPTATVGVIVSRPGRTGHLRGACTLIWACRSLHSSACCW